ncbi:PglL family O-oligosaccharyltransferase [Hydrogenophaga sp. IBVHS2]|uniref:PglL family O-oligosaccharyltransferase n=1 Tax=Hydrogenophaga sp. IBVHS2 TaxID=1985170 RepID=UPI000A2E7CBE|nr:O-antigen ligase family protein [Hydrogenophaga sp. IBVHS2]OSZ64033.1 hypothetical protein CAP38_12190 [Hydrogenophaga sp. IBVHS2]
MTTNAPSLRLQTFEDALAACLLALAWLVPNHQLPWTAFHHELVMGVALGSMLVLLAWQARQGLGFPAFGLLVMLLALMPWVQWGFGILPKMGIAFISSAYIGAVGLAIALGFSIRGMARERLMGILTLALIMAALLNLPIQLIQWFQWYTTDITSVQSMLITPIASDSRPSGSILQPNLLATLQVWALLGLTWWRVERRLSGPIFLLVFVLVVTGMALTQSRAGMLEMALCTAVLGLFARKWAGPRVCIVWAVMLALLVVWSLNFQAVADWLGVRGAAEGRLSAIDGARIDAWLAFGLAVLESPWWGFGITDVGYPYFLQAETRPDIYIGQRFGHAHNLLLDLALWVGIPLAALLTTLSVAWGWRRWQDAIRTPSLLIPVLMLMSLTVHSMLELPHQYLYLLVPAGLCIGMLCAASGAAPVMQLGRAGAIAAAFSVWAVAAVTAWDYFPYQERYTEWRFDNLGVGYRLDRPIKPPLVLDQLHDELVLYRTDFTKPLSSEQLDWVEETARAVTTAPAMYYAAQALAMGGRTQDALRWMRRYNAVTPPELVEQTRRIWARDQRTHPAMRGIDWPPYAGRLSTFRFETEPTSGP